MTNGWTQRKSSVKHTSSAAQSLRSQTAGSISVTLTRAPDGAPMTAGASGQQVMDLGPVSYGAGPRVANVEFNKRPDRFVVATKLGLVIQDATGRSSSAAVLVSLAYPESMYTFWIDGVKLATTPQSVQAHAQLGITQSHSLQIEVPATLSEKNSQLQNAVVFQVVPN
jgi:hypothetical protein